MCIKGYGKDKVDSAKAYQTICEIYEANSNHTKAEKMYNVFPSLLESVVGKFQRTSLQRNATFMFLEIAGYSC